MHRVIPKSFIVAETGVNVELLNQYLAQVVEESYAREYKMDPNLSDMDERKADDYAFATTEVAENIKDSTPAEALVALMGRMCYRSFAPGLNPNVSRTRTGITPYIDHIFKSGHGSVLEHSTVSVIFHNVSRVFTHEIVRHRAGTAMSQESLRFVRLDDLGLWLPPEIQSDPELTALFEETFTSLETLQLKMAAHCKIDDIKNFDIKKKLTSAFRRIAPEGLATTIGFTANFRAWRHMFTMRGSGGAEAEMRIVYFDLAKQFAKRYKTMFGDLRFLKLDTKQQFAVNELPEHAVWSDYEIVLLHTGV